MEDWEFAWDNNNCCILRSRGGSKTFDFINWVIFRAVRCNERWMWITPKSGQLRQAKVYFMENPLVKSIRNLNNMSYIVTLWNGSNIICGIISTSNLGMRVDGIIYDEFEDLQIKQEEEVYPQMSGMLTTSTTHKQIYLGTRWINTLFDEYCNKYPTKTRPWDKIKWLVDSGMIKAEIDEGVTPDWQIDLLYRCIPTLPGGLLFPNIHISPIPSSYTPNRYGLDFGSKDMCVGVYIKDKECYILEEYEVELERFNDALDFIKGSVEVEAGGYNTAKADMMIKRVRAHGVPVTREWKSERQMKGRGMNIYVDPERTPNVYKDLKGATFGPDGLYLKNTTHPCHWLDAFLHTLHPEQILDVPELKYRKRRQRWT